MLETAEEERNRKTRNAFIIAIILIIGFIISIGIKGYDKYGPLPQTTECEAQGYQSGIKEGNNSICFDKCETNKIQSCKITKLIDETK